MNTTHKDKKYWMKLFKTWAVFSAMAFFITVIIGVTLAANNVIGGTFPYLIGPTLFVISVLLTLFCLIKSFWTE